MSLDKKKDMAWAPATWNLLHTIAEKIHEDTFPTYREELIRMTKTICGVLPCPTCSADATRLLKGYKSYNNIKTKQDFKLFLFGFHNIVNQKTKKDIQPETILEIYKQKQLIIVLNYWMQHFKTPGLNTRLIMEDMHRTRTKKYVYNFVIQNMRIFNMN